MGGHAIYPDIYDDDTLQCITWIIIGYGNQYFRQSLMKYAFTGNITEEQI